MNLSEMLDELLIKAKKDPAIKSKLLETRGYKDELERFCAVCRKLGYPIYEMDLVTAGEDFYAQMRRSTNGGGENSPMLVGEDDYYELFFASLADL